MNCGPAGMERAQVRGAENPAPTLADQGVDKKLSARAQKPAAAPLPRWLVAFSRPASRARVRLADILPTAAASYRFPLTAT